MFPNRFAGSASRQSQTRNLIESFFLFCLPIESFLRGSAPSIACSLSFSHNCNKIKGEIMEIIRIIPGSERIVLTKTSKVNSRYLSFWLPFRIPTHTHTHTDASYIPETHSVRWNRLEGKIPQLNLNYNCMCTVWFSKYYMYTICNYARTILCARIKKCVYL